MTNLPPAEPIEIAVRAFGVRVERKRPGKKAPMAGRRFPSSTTAPESPWTLTFDTEFAIDAAQQLRLGSYQVRNAGQLVESGLFFDPLSLTDGERDLLHRFALNNDLEVRDVGEFVEAVFFRVLVDWSGTCVGFNLPLDLSRLAIRHDTTTSRDMRGGFTYILSEDPRRPRVQVRHLNSTQAFIRLTYPAKQPTPRGMRKRGLHVPRTRGSFVDVHTAASALLEFKGTLGDLAKLLDTASQKATAEFHTPALTAEFLAYAMTDAQVTWECYERLAARHEALGLARPLTKIYSAASLGKATLEAMGIEPWLRRGRQVPRHQVGQIMSSYYGGRSEVHRRRQIVRVLYADVLSMYPTVGCLLGLWKFVVADGFETYDATEETRAFLATVTPDDLQRPETWRRLTVLVELEPDADLLPVRGKYGGEAYTIGLNFLSTGGGRLWYTLPDIVNAAINGIARPRIRRAIGFRPGPLQPGLRSIDLMGNPAYRVEPAADDVFRRLVELRTELKAKRDAAKAAGDIALADQYDADQLALKILANATSYGIYVQLDVTDSDDPLELLVYGRSGEPYHWTHPQFETPGPFFHPLLAALTTGAARLMLGLAERRILDAGLDWAFCDTDSMAIVKPEAMADAEFERRALAVLDWFERLKPYRVDDRLFKLESANFRLDAGGRPTAELELLYCFAVSDKRYALFNLDAAGRPVLRKASGHGLGHLRPPYGSDEAPASISAPVVSRKDLGVPRWQHDVWFRIVEAALAGHPDQVDLSDLQNFDNPAVSRYAATTPELLHWFDRYNAGRQYREQVRPFNFLSAFQARNSRLGSSDPLAAMAPSAPVALEVPAVVGPYDDNVALAAAQAFDRANGEPVPPSSLRSYREVLAQYHLHPESKFEGGEYLDAGTTRRRHVRPLGPIDNTGKEANRWEEQFYLGWNPETQLRYGQRQADIGCYLADVRARMAHFGIRQLVRESGLSVGTISTVRRGIARPSLRVLRSIDRAIWGLQRQEVEAPSRPE